MGLRWPYVDFEAELFHPQWQLQRLTWRHGCKNAQVCGESLHRFEPCPKDCRRHATACPERKGGGLVFTRPKTKKSTTPVPIPPPFIPYLYVHKEQQDEMRTAAGDKWQKFDALFTRPDGRPLAPPAPTGRSSRNYLRRQASQTVACTTGAATPLARSLTNSG